MPSDLMNYIVGKVIVIYSMSAVCLYWCEKRITSDCKKKYKGSYPWYLRLFGREYRRNVKKCVNENYDKCRPYCICLVEDALHNREPSCTEPTI